MNVGGADPGYWFIFTPGHESGGKSCYLWGFKLILRDADAGDYVHSVICYEDTGAGGPNIVENNDNGGANFKTTGTHEVQYAAPHDISSYDLIHFLVNCSTLQANDLDVVGLKVGYYYE